MVAGQESTYLLDANLSPKIGRYLSDRFGLDIVSLLTLGLGEISDQEVSRLARASGRIIITLDSDFAKPHSITGRERRGVIFLDLPNSRRYIPQIQQILDSFFRDHAETIDLEHAFVVLTEDHIEIHHS